MTQVACDGVCQYAMSMIDEKILDDLLYLILVIDHAHYPKAAEVGDSWQLLNCDFSPYIFCSIWQMSVGMHQAFRERTLCLPLEGDCVLSLHGRRPLAAVGRVNDLQHLLGDLVCGGGTGGPRLGYKRVWITRGSVKCV